MRSLISVAAGLLAGATMCCWSEEQVYKSPEKSLAADPNGLLELEVDQLPPHKYLKLSLDLRIRVPVRERRRFLPDEKESRDVLEVATGERILFESSFSDSNLSQSFPDAYGTFNHLPRTGSTDFGVAGARLKYQFDLVLPHDEDSIALSFEWLRKVKGSAGGRIVGVDNSIRFDKRNVPFVLHSLTISTLDEVVLDQESAGRLLDTISGQDGLAAHAAMQTLIAGGDEALAFVRGRFSHSEIDPSLTGKFEAAVEKLGSDSFAERSKAEIDLVEMGVGVLPHVKRELGDDSTPIWARVGLRKTEKRLMIEAQVANQVLANRLRAALGLLETEGAKMTLEVVPAATKLDFFGSEVPDLRRKLGHDFGPFDLPVIDRVIIEPLPVDRALELELEPEVLDLPFFPE